MTYVADEALAAALDQLGKVALGDIAPARLDLHYAAQVVAAVGFTFVRATPDLLHTTLSWGSGGLRGELAPGEYPFRAALAVGFGAVCILDEDDRVLGRKAAAGQTLEALYEWTSTKVVEIQGRPVPALVRPTHELPPHSVATGSTFDNMTAAHLRELENWFEAAALALGAVSIHLPDPTPVRCWSHHFDIATLGRLDGDKSIGVGLSPGDASDSEPYFYVTPWPYPAASELPKLPTGHWHTDGFTAAVLPGRALMHASGGAARQAVLASFIEAAVEGCRSILE